MQRGTGLSELLPHETPSLSQYLRTSKLFGAKFATRYRVGLRSVITGGMKYRYPWVMHTHYEAGVEVPDTALTKTRQELDEAAFGAVKGPAATAAESEQYEVVEVTPLYGLHNPWY